MKHPTETTTALICHSARPNQRTSRTAFADGPPDADDPLLGFAPYVHRAPRRNSITPDRQRAFIAALAATGIVTQAARSIGASLEALYKLRNLPGAHGFAAAWEAAIDRGVARLEDSVLERAIQGEERPVCRNGEVVATYTRYDTHLALFLLRQRRSQRFAVSSSHYGNLRPGHPVYEKLKKQWMDETFEDEETILQSINAKLDKMRANERAVSAMLAEESQTAQAADGDAGGDSAA
ncbi:MAG: hypothetical protein RLZZ136_1191 [Pseudomonadota bacterium]|jgi:hypothetical protein